MLWMVIGSQPFIAGRGVLWIRYNFGPGTQRTWFSSRTHYLTSCVGKSLHLSETPFFPFVKSGYWWICVVPSNTVFLWIGTLHIWSRCFSEGSSKLCNPIGYSERLREAAWGPRARFPQGESQLHVPSEGLTVLDVIGPCLTLLFKRHTPGILFVTVK